MRTLAKLGWIVERVIAGDEPDDVVRRFREALHRRGYRDTDTTHATHRRR
jgi:hypothetical protein